jgi:quercetin dioxygenase-like cupin family protein
VSRSPDDRLLTAGFESEALEAARAAAGRLYHEFLRVPAMSAGLYVLEAGAIDPQRPHLEDEVYVVMAGRGRLRMGEEDIAVSQGSVAFVAAGIDHRFHDIEERLSILVLFAPPETEPARPAQDRPPTPPEL